MESLRSFNGFVSEFFRYKEHQKPQFWLFLLDHWTNQSFGVDQHPKLGPHFSRFFFTRNRNRTPRRAQLPITGILAIQLPQKLHGPKKCAHPEVSVEESFLDLSHRRRGRCPENPKVE